MNCQFSLILMKLLIVHQPKTRSAGRVYTYSIYFETIELAHSTIVNESGYLGYY